MTTFRPFKLALTAKKHFDLYLIVVLSLNHPSFKVSYSPLSIFQIVNFPNSECASEAGDAGVCMTSGECLSRSGLVSGSCAQGFGACCLVYSDQCGGSLEYNNTYIRYNNCKYVHNITHYLGTQSFRKPIQNNPLVSGKSRRYPRRFAS